MNLELNGLRVAPSQSCGAIRLVPLLRDKPCPDVRLALRDYKNDLGLVDLHDGSFYWSFIPHGLILSWGQDRMPVAALGAQLKRMDGKRHESAWLSVRCLDKMVQRVTKNALRLLPLHLAMEGFLALHFGGPNIAWKEYSRHGLKYGLSPRSEMAVPGKFLPGFEDALRTFEIHEGQVGVLLFVAEQLASAFVVPSPEDYKLLHGSLLEDFYGELIYRYALWHEQSAALDQKPDVRGAENLSDLRKALSKVREDWADFSQNTMSRELIGRDLKSEVVYKPGELKLERFLTDLEPNSFNHIGERLVRENGELLYLKTFQLSVAQTKRAYLLSQLAAHDWHLADTAQALKIGYHDLISRIETLGFGTLIREDVLAKARKEQRLRVEKGKNN